jgi:hypothetical protein
VSFTIFLLFRSASVAGFLDRKRPASSRADKYIIGPVALAGSLANKDSWCSEDDKYNKWWQCKQD